MAVRARQRILGIGILWLAGLWSPCAFGAYDVLVVFDEDKDLPGLSAINRSLREGLQTEFDDSIVFYNESLQLSQFGKADYDAPLREFFLRKYAGKRFDLIVAVMEPSLDFLLRQRESLFTGVPIVYCGIDSSDLERRALPEDITGVMMKRSFAPSLELALKLQPGTRHVFVIGGSSRFDLRMQDIARRDFQPFEQRASFTWLTTQPMEELLGWVATLPEHSIIFYLTLFADGANQPFVTHDALRRINEAANSPVYVAVDQYVGSGAVGGSVFSVHSIGEQAAQISARILRGEAATDIPPIALSAYTPLFDWRQLQRWKLDSSRLPANASILHRTPTAWQSYRWYIIGGITLFLLQTALVVGLLVNRAQRLRAEQARQESEAHRRRAEADAQRQREELAHALRLTTLGELTASISHELNQPLTAIAANAQAAQKLFENDRANPELEDALEDMVDDAIRAAEIIRRLQVLFRKKPSIRIQLGMNELIDEVLHLLGSDLRNREIRVFFERHEPLAKVMGDGVQLRQVIINLLRNAEEAIASAGDGFREIHISTSQPDDDRVAIAIRDTGLGVQDPDLDRIFEHFVSSKPQGLGMGLAISRSIIESHSGRIWAERNEGRGLTLRIEIPSAAEKPPMEVSAVA
jgi:C4-dicarboxylate-specific signal transduction histidine kinase